MIAVALVSFSAVGTLSSLVFIREQLEIDKQRLIAQNHARRQLELIRRNLFTSISDETVTIDNFNTPDDPDDDLVGVMTTTAWEVNPDGTTGSAVSSFPLEERKRVLVQVSVTWNRLGRLSPTTAVEVMQTYVAPR
jgi:type II secretory pathway pseudopilin PulG